MSKQIMIIGLGQFGMSLARTLAERGAEVLAVDISQEKVDAASEFVSRAVAVDATDENALAGLLPAERDAVVCAMGDSSKDAAIICTALSSGEPLMRPIRSLRLFAMRLGLEVSPISCLKLRANLRSSSIFSGFGLSWTR